MFISSTTALPQSAQANPNVTEVFFREARLPVKVEEVFAWHERPGALDRLIPPWESVSVEERAAGVRNGDCVVLLNKIGPMPVRWVAEHYDYQKNLQFRDRQTIGPFAYWDHLHAFRSDGDSATIMSDRVEYQLPGGPVGRLLGGGFVREKLDKMFDYRHKTVMDDLRAHAKYNEKGTMHVAITGSSGLVGSELIPFLTTGGHEVTRIVRGDPKPGEVAWHPSQGEFDPTKLERVDAVVHLAGENIAGGRWNEERKQRIRKSRVEGTRLLCEGLARMETPPKVLVSASAVGIYGDRGAELLDESSPAGDGFLAEVAEEWEQATRPASEAGIRVVNLRFGMILSPKGGALGTMLTPFKLGVGGVVGSGEQYWSWISLDDVIGAIHHVLMNDSLSGAVNAVAPDAVTNKEFTKTLGRVLGRPTVLPVPKFAAKLAMGEMADELLLASARVKPQRLMDSGFEFRQPNLEEALRYQLGR